MTWIERKQGMDGGARKRSLRDSRRMGSKNADGPGDQGPGEMEEARDRDGFRVRQPVHDVGIILFPDNHLLPAQRTPDLTPGAYRFNGIGQARIAKGHGFQNVPTPGWSPRRALRGGSRQQWPAVSNGFCFDSPAFCFFAFEKRDPRIALSTSDIKSSDQIWSQGSSPC